MSTSLSCRRRATSSSVVDSLSAALSGSLHTEAVTSGPCCCGSLAKPINPLDVAVPNAEADTERVSMCFGEGDSLVAKRPLEEQLRLCHVFLLLRPQHVSKDSEYMERPGG